MELGLRGPSTRGTQAEGQVHRPRVADLCAHGTSGGTTQVPDAQLACRRRHCPPRAALCAPRRGGPRRQRTGGGSAGDTGTRGAERWLTRAERRQGTCRVAAAVALERAV